MDELDEEIILKILNFEERSLFIIAALQHHIKPLHYTYTTKLNGSIHATTTTKS